MHLTTLSFPDIKLRQSDGHKLRGYFANTFGQDSDLYHNHREDGTAIYRYPRIQFKIIHGHPVVIGIADGAQLLIDRFLSLKEIEIAGKVYRLKQKQLKSEEVTCGIVQDLITYCFDTPWLALNQRNFSNYKKTDTPGKQQLLKKILIGNILSFYKAMGLFIDETLLVQIALKPIKTNFKNQSMIAFDGQFTTNAVLPMHIGIGKSVSRGYGSIKTKNFT